MPNRCSRGGTAPSSSSPSPKSSSFYGTTTSASLLLAALRARETGGNAFSACVSYYCDDDDEETHRRAVKAKKNAGKKKKNLENEMRVDDDELLLLRDKTEETLEGEDDEENDEEEDAKKCCFYAPPLSPTTTLHNYVEQDSLKRFTASYCPLVPNPRSTIANAYSSDGKRVASTHGDHTVKIIDVATGLCVKVLAGHRRTPWVVRFHPSDPNILASGSLDNTVRVWDISEDKDGVQSEGGKCIAVRDFNKPIASIAFSLDGGCVLVASGHRLTYWRYPDYQLQLQQQQQQQQQQQMMIDEVNNQSGTTTESTQQQPMEESKETVNILLKTKRSLRCALFRPRGLPLILTAEVNDIGLEHTPGSSMGAANLAVTGLSYTGPSPFVAVQMPRDLQSGVYVARGFRGNFNSVHNQQQQRNAAEQAATKKKKQQEEANNRNKSEENNSENQLLDNIDNEDGTQNMVSSAPTTRTSRTMTDFDRAASRRRASIDLERTTGIAPRGRLVAPMDVDTTAEVAAAVGGYIRRTQRNNQRQNVGNMDGREGLAPSPADVDINDGDIEIVEDPLDGYDATAAEQRLAAIRNTIGGLRVVDIHGRDAAYDAGASRFAQQVAEETSSRPGQEQPCAVQIKLWRYNPANVNVALENACLTLRRAVLCSEMGAHFSPCGNFLAACVICQHHAVGEHLYELRVYSLQKRNFGEVLSARRIRAAHCLTSVQFSPTSEHVLVAYGRKHSSLILLVADGGNYQPVHTILEVYRVADMGLVRVIPSAEDEVNAATFHPHPGGGLVYGTKEGRLRLLRFEGGRDKRHRKNKNRNGRPNSPRSTPSLEDELMVRRRSANEESNSDDDEDYDDDAIDAENP
jgi:activator-of-BECN1-regulated-autophagy protein 1